MSLVSTEQQSTKRYSMFPSRRLRKLGLVATHIAENKDHILVQQRPLNNDAMAPVHTLLHNERGSEYTERQLYAEYVTDMSERATETPFYTSFSYARIGQDYIANTGESLTNILASGLEAAKADALYDPDLNIGVDMALAYQYQPTLILNWELSPETRPLLLVSLCPPPSELPEDIAKKLSRKQDRLMASMWMMEKVADGSVSVKAFSLDNLRLADLMNMRDLGLVEGEVANDTVSQMYQPLIVNNAHSADEAVEHIRTQHDLALQSQTGNAHYFGISTVAKTTANEIIANNPQAYHLYRSIVSEVALSLVQERPTEGLKGHLAYLANPFNEHNVPSALSLGSSYTEKDGRALMEYLRSQAFPHFLFNRSVNSTDASVASFGMSDIAEAGADATVKGLAYDGACTTSELLESQTQQTLAETFQQKSNVELLQCVTCPFCKKETTAKVVHSANTIECMRAECRAKLNTKTGKRIDEKYSTQQKYQTLADLIVTFFFGDESKVNKQKILKSKLAAKSTKEKVDLAT